jgi:hypothetical protein
MADYSGWSSSKGSFGAKSDDSRGNVGVMAPTKLCHGQSTLVHSDFLSIYELRRYPTVKGRLLDEAFRLTNFFLARDCG